jgi:adenosylhomocysteine nucleosidase
MEAATVARLSEMRRVPFYCFKAVSDSSQAELPDLNRFIDTQGQMRMTAFVAHAAARPRYWGPLMELGRNSAVAAHALAENVNRFLAEQTKGKNP